MSKYDKSADRVLKMQRLKLASTDPNLDPKFSKFAADMHAERRTMFLSDEISGDLRNLMLMNWLEERIVGGDRFWTVKR